MRIPTTRDTAESYDRISGWWDAQPPIQSGLSYVNRIIDHLGRRGFALDVGCGTGGLKLQALVDSGFKVTGLDASKKMLDRAVKNHAGVTWVHADIVEWSPPRRYGLILAWDSIFHLPTAAQRVVLAKLCDSLEQGGIFLFTAGGVEGERGGTMAGEPFYYSSLDASEYEQIAQRSGCQVLFVERDQAPEHHVVIATQRRS